MWPTPDTPLYLGLGLIPVLYVLMLIARLGLKEALSLRTAGVAFIWVGYHLSPWLAYISNEPWISFLLVSGHVNDGLLFSSLCMFGFIIGYGFILGYGAPPKALRKYSHLQFPKVKAKWLIWLSIISVALFIVSVGGIDEVWISSRARGAGQFDARDLAGKILHMLKVITIAFNIVVVCVAGLFIIQNKRKPLLQALGWLSIFIASLRMIWWFSRGAGFGFIILAFLALRVGGRRRIVLAAASIAMALYLGSVGLNERGMYSPGLGSFLQAVWTPSNNGDGAPTTMLFTTPNSNPLDAMAAWTRKTQTRHQDMPSIGDMILPFLWNLNPLPSEIFPLAKIGESLSTVMGTVGSTGLTTPALAEIYYVFGYPGSIVMAIFGAICAWFEKLTITRPGPISSIGLLLTFVSFPIGLHSSTRAMTRPVLYAYAFCVFMTRFSRERCSRSRRHVSDQRELIY